MLEMSQSQTNTFKMPLHFFSINHFLNIQFSLSDDVCVRCYCNRTIPILFVQKYSRILRGVCIGMNVMRCIWDVSTYCMGLVYLDTMRYYVVLHVVDLSLSHMLSLSSQAPGCSAHKHHGSLPVKHLGVRHVRSAIAP